jgi:hypothetical protein
VIYVYLLERHRQKRQKQAVNALFKVLKKRKEDEI